MPFTPKFVDLVRNATSVQGTGPVTLGAAVSGFTGLAAAVSPGEQFYYCIQGVDKPAEREVGRGTMQANGTVAREAIGGALTNFTSGAKTIALVAAAEWFSRLDQLGAGAAPFDVASRGALAAASTTPARPAYLCEKGREGLFLFDPGNLSAWVATDSAQGIYVAPAAAPNGASGAWVRQFDGALQLEWFGAVPGDYATGISADCLPAWQALQAYLSAHNRNVSIGGTGAGPEIAFPGAQYYFSDTLQIKHTLRLRGMGVGSPGGEATWLRFPANKAGIVVNRSNTLGDALQSPATSGGDGTLIEGFLLQGGGGAVSEVLTEDLLYSGIRLRARATIRDCIIRNFRGAGICISAAVGDGTNPFHGNANNWKVDTVRIETCRTHGLYVSGGDANAGVATAVDASRNGLFNIFDDSFLGNTYIGCHTDAGNYISNGFGDGRTGLVSHAGNYYYLKQGVSKATAQATTPGTNAAVWVLIGPGIANANTPAWTATGNYHPGGAYGGPGDFCLFLGCYYETGQGPPQIGPSGLILAGFMGSGVSGEAVQLFGGANGLQSQRQFTQKVSYADGSSAAHAVGGDMSGSALELLTWNSSLATPGNPGAKGALLQNKLTGDITWKDTQGSEPMRLTGAGTARAYGGRPVAECKATIELNQFALGNGLTNAGNNCLIFKSGSGAPASGYHGRGDIVWNSGAVVGVATTSFWRCTVAGTPGTWTAVGPLGTSAIGYTTGGGGTSTQTGGKSGAVTINAPSGKITMDAASLAAGATTQFQFVNSSIAANDVVIVNIASGATLNSYTVGIASIAGGQCRIQLRNISAAALAEAVVFNFAVIKGAVA